MTPASKPTNRASWRPTAWVAAVAAVLAGMYTPVAGVYWERWVGEEPYHHCLFVPLVVGWLIWRKRDRLRAIAPRPAPGGLVLLGVALLIYVVAMRIGVRVAVGFTFPIVIIALAWTAMGTRRIRLLAYPLALLFFVIPIPRHVLGHVGMPLQVISAEGAARVAKFGGLAVVHDGIALTLNGHSFVVAEACSGLNSMMALLFAAAVLVEIMEVAALRRLVLLAAPVIVLAANTVRLTSVLVFAEFAGPGFALDSLVHGGSDIILYLAGLGFMWVLIDAVSERRLLAIIIGDHVMAKTEPGGCAGCGAEEPPARLEGAGE